MTHENGTSGGVGSTGGSAVITDTMRLDWLNQCVTNFRHLDDPTRGGRYAPYMSDLRGVRDAIDAAMREPNVEMTDANSKNSKP